VPEISTPAKSCHHFGDVPKLVAACYLSMRIMMMDKGQGGLQGHASKM
jgi:hypothetical protein